MAEIPENLKYANSHEWVLVENDGTATIGITDYAQSNLGDITFVQLREVGGSLGAGEAFGVIESVKAASDVYSPVAGLLVAVNKRLKDQPEIVNQSPYDEGWLIKLAMVTFTKALLTPSEYREHTR